MPGHAAAWRAGHPEIMADCEDKYYYNINDWALNPTLERTYDVLAAVVRWVRHIMRDETRAIWEPWCVVGARLAQPTPV